MTIRDRRHMTNYALVSIWIILILILILVVVIIIVMVVLFLDCYRNDCSGSPG